VKINRIIILGAGYAGITLATNLDKQLSKNNSKIILIDFNNHPELIQQSHLVAWGFKKLNEVYIPIDNLIKNINIEFKQAFVRKIIADENRIITDKFEIEYDFLVIALGATTKFFDIKGAEEYRLTLRSMEDALTINKGLNSLTKRIKNNSITVDVEKMQVLIIGGGATGVQLAGAIADFIISSWNENNIHIKIITSSSLILPGWDTPIVEAVKETLQKKGVQIITDSFVTEVKKDGIIVNDSKQYLSSLTIWTPGVEGFDIHTDPQIEKTKDGRIIVDGYCQNMTFPNIFCIGDISAILDFSGQTQYPPLGQLAISKAIYLSKAFSKYFIFGKRPSEIFTRNVRIRILSLGIHDYIGTIGKHLVMGDAAKIVKDLKSKVHLESLYSQGTHPLQNIYQEKELSDQLVDILAGQKYLENNRP
jgi:NADH:ubiquinone reductase (H+-translocating)